MFERKVWWRGLVMMCALAFLLGGCGLIPEAARPTHTPTLTPSPTETLEPDADGVDSTPAPRATAQGLRTPVTPVVDSNVAAYTLDVQLDYDARKAQVRETIRAVNPSDAALDEIPLVVEANLLEGVFTLGAVRINGGAPLQNTILESTLLRVPLASPLAAGAGFTLELTYQLDLPLTYGWLSFTGKQLNLGDWYPFIPAWQASKGFLTHNPGASGEYLVYPRISYEVVLTLAEREIPLVVAASAPPVREEDETTYYTLEGGRSFAFSISPDFEVLHDGLVDMYFYPESSGAAQASLRVAKESLELYSELFAAYPYARLAVVEGDFFDGMEFSGLFFLGAEYFAAYPNNPQSYLTALSAHETAHQWWYSLVGNDAALEPWVDEALATYSEVLYYEKFYPDLVPWWWNYRVDRFEPSGPVNSTIYAYGDFRGYVNAVYLNGARFLDAARKQMGEEAFLAVLQQAAAQQAGLLTGDALLGLLRSQGGSGMDDLIAEYFSQQ